MIMNSDASSAIPNPVQARTSSIPQRTLYRPLGFALFRTPLLPIESFEELCGLHEIVQFGTSLCHDEDWQERIRLLSSSAVQLALAIGSTSLYEALQRRSQTPPTGRKLRKARQLRSKLLRYLIRMSTRPTPYGMFAGVALATFGGATNLGLLQTAARRMSRPDMEVLWRIARDLEENEEVRSQLKVARNPAAFERAGRIVINEPQLRNKEEADTEVSVRATTVVKQVLDSARTPIEYRELAQQLLKTDGATEERVAKLLAELWEQRLLLTDLVPSLSGSPPAYALSHTLSEVDGCVDKYSRLREFLKSLESGDVADGDAAIGAYKHASGLGRILARSETQNPIQVDTAAELEGNQISHAIGMEAAWAAELLIRMTPYPHGSPTTAAYRTAFLSRYGEDREIPLLEMLDANVGLGPYSKQQASSTSSPRDTQRGKILVELACRAVRLQQRVLELDESVLKTLQTWSPNDSSPPKSLDLNVFVAAQSVKAIDDGDFRVVVGPNVGAMAAGRNLGRFAHLLGSDAQDSLREAARTEDSLDQNQLPVELVYMPSKSRLANVAIRPRIRQHEIRVGISPTDDSAHQVSLDEILVGVKDNHFYLRCPRINRNLRITAGHMLNPMMAPEVCRFLTAASSDDEPQVLGFSWGPAESFPFLPRVQSGRVVLRPAEWKISWYVASRELASGSEDTFTFDFAAWQELWHVPRHVFLTQADNRLLLDLTNVDHIEELRLEVKKLRASDIVNLQEVIPELNNIWTTGPEGRYYSEFVVPLVLDELPMKQAMAQQLDDNLHNMEVIGERSSSIDSTRSSQMSPDFGQGVRMFPPGSDWLFLKLYCGLELQDDLICGPLHSFVQQITDSFSIDRWFFIRYADPDAHIRLRFHGPPDVLLTQVFPNATAWSQQLMSQGVIQRLAVDTYDREVERYGGPEGMAIAEEIFYADSRSILVFRQLLRHELPICTVEEFAMLSIDNLLSGIGLSETDRLEWLRANVPQTKQHSREHRSRKDGLRQLLSGYTLKTAEGGEKWDRALGDTRVSLRHAGERLGLLSSQFLLTKSRDVILNSIVHMHLNRLIGLDRVAELRVREWLRLTRESLSASPMPLGDLNNRRQ